MERQHRLDKMIQRFLYYLTIALFAALGLLLFANVVLRLINDFANFLTRHGLDGAATVIKAVMPMTSLHWFDEIVEMCFAGLVFYGSAALWATKGHFSVGDFISRRLPGHVSRAIYKIVVSAVCVVFIAVFFWFSLRLTLRSTELTTVFQIPKSLLYGCMPVSSFLMLLWSLAELAGDVKRLFVRDGAEIATQEFQSL